MKYDFLSKLSLLKHQAFQIKALKKEQEHLKQKCRQFEALLAQTDYLPIPPQELIVRVDYSDDVDLFLGVGRIIFWEWTLIPSQLDGVKQILVILLSLKPLIFFHLFHILTTVSTLFSVSQSLRTCQKICNFSGWRN
jgi:hypothetical protein